MKTSEMQATAQRITAALMGDGLLKPDNASYVEGRVLRALATPPGGSPQECVGYPDCDGYLPGEAHDPKCPLFNQAAWDAQQRWIEKMRAAETPAASEPERTPQHGIDCPKVEHYGEGYSHDKDHDQPYDVDGIEYCGRCHGWMGSRAAAPPAQGAPMPAREYKHWPHCNADRRKPAGEPGTGCCCFYAPLAAQGAPGTREALTVPEKVVQEIIADVLCDTIGVQPRSIEHTRMIVANRIDEWLAQPGAPTKEG